MTDETKGDGMTLEKDAGKAARQIRGSIIRRLELFHQDFPQHWCGYLDDALGAAEVIEQSLLSLAAQSAKIDVSPDFPLGAIENGRVFADRLEQTDLSCVAGDLHLCVDWHEFRRCFEYMAEWCMGQAAQSAMRVDEASSKRERWVNSLIAQVRRIDKEAWAIGTSNISIEALRGLSQTLEMEPMTTLGGV